MKSQACNEKSNVHLHILATGTYGIRMSTVTVMRSTEKSAHLSMEVHCKVGIYVAVVLSIVLIQIDLAASLHA